MSEATVSFYSARAGTRHVTGEVKEWLPGRRAVVETDDGERITGLVVPEPLTVDGAQ